MNYWGLLAKEANEMRIITKFSKCDLFNDWEYTIIYPDGTLWSSSGYPTKKAAGKDCRSQIEWSRAVCARAGISFHLPTTTYKHPVHWKKGKTRIQ